MNKILFFLLFVFSFFSVLPLWGSEYFPMHDDTQVARVIAMSAALQDGVLPVRWVDMLGYGYGYPIFNFYAPLAYYVGGILLLLGIPPVAATKIMFGIGMLTAGLSMYLLAKAFWGELAGLLSALLYLYAPYHAVNLYVRGAIGELWAYGFIPLVFWGFYKLFNALQKGNKKNIWYWIGVSGFAYSALILSHNLTAFIVTPFLVILLLFFCIVLYKQHKRFVHLIYAFCLGLLFSAFYWLPALLELSYTNVASILGGGSNPKDHFVCLSQLWTSNWGFAGSAPGCIDGMSFMIGKLHVILALSSFFAVLFWQKGVMKNISFMLFIGLLSSVFLMLSLSRSLWESIPFMIYIQFPWRYLTMASFFTSLLSGGILFVLLNRVNLSYFKKVALGVFIGLLIIFIYGKFFVPQYKIYDLAHYSNKDFIRWHFSKISDEYLPSDFKKPKSDSDLSQSILEFIEGSGKIYIDKKTTTHLKASIVVLNDALIRIQRAYFPAWRIVLNGVEKTPTITNGVYYLSLPPGDYRLEMSFVQTPIEKVANSLSLFGIFIFIACIIYAHRKVYR